MTGKPIETFTRASVEWDPYIEPVALADATPEQRRAMQVTPSNQKVSAYVLTLAHDPESLEQRSPLYNAIMYGPGGLPRRDRELAALGTSMVNRCIYCAAVHADRLVALTKDGTLADALLGEETTGMTERQAAVWLFAQKLSQTPSAVASEDIAKLRRLGLDDAEILDLVNAAAIFAWANRLMHTLGRPIEP
jgi:uncharacterized peroxidase-related enzyme